MSLLCSDLSRPSNCGLVVTANASDLDMWEAQDVSTTWVSWSHALTSTSTWITMSVTPGTTINRHLKVAVSNLRAEQTTNLVRGSSQIVHWTLLSSLLKFCFRSFRTIQLLWTCGLSVWLCSVWSLVASQSVTTRSTVSGYLRHIRSTLKWVICPSYPHRSLTSFTTPSQLTLKIPSSQFLWKTSLKLTSSKRWHLKN